MPNPTPHIENTKVDGGDRANPVITEKKILGYGIQNFVESTRKD